jgi:Ni,Fe-hydrogenase I large subunit
LLAQIKAFVGEATDFATGTAGTMMFDVVAAAHLFPEYFWIGNSWGNFMAFGWGEAAGTVPLTGSMATIYGSSYSFPDNRALTRGYKLSASMGADWHAVDILNIGESVANSRYNKDGSGNYPNGKAFLHPWSGQTTPNPDKAYSWLKSPRYNVGTPSSPDWRVMEVGPLARMVVSGFYWGGILNGFYPVTPAWGAAGPDIANGVGVVGGALKPVYAAIPGVTGGPNLSGVSYMGDSVLDRIAARALETRLICDIAAHTLTQLDSTTYDAGGWSETGATAPKVPNVTKVKKGYGMSEASRGALSHWMKMKNGKITLYQAVVPTTWNASPRDVLGQQGPAEKSVEGSWVANPAEPIELPRITHSYDFCIACAVHLVTPKGDVVKVDIPALPS